jgi:integrase
MRFAKPFFRASKGAWYLQLGKRQISLGKEREEAFKRYREILLHERGETSEPAFRRLTVAQVFDLFLDWSSRHNGARTYEWYRDFLQSFSDRCGALQAEKLKPFHLTRWLDSHPGWGEASRRCATIAVKRAFNWAEAEGILSPNPLKHVKKGPPKRRERILTADEWQQILKAARGRAFREFVQALQETGCRPSEVAKVEAPNVDLAAGLWVLPEHKTRKKTGKPRVVYLTPAMVELTRNLVESHPTGPLFRNSRGKAWSRNAIRCRFRNLRRKLPQLKGVVSYTYRHSFVTDALENGVGVAQVAELLGHTSTEMVMQHYQHLREKRDHLRQAAVQATQQNGQPAAPVPRVG